MGKLGSRFLFIEMPDEEQSDAELVYGAASGRSYRERVGLCRDAVTDLLDDLWRDTGGVRGVAWQRDADPEPVMLRIAAFAKVLARLRGTISFWREGSGEDETYNFSTPVIEGPQRAMSLLYALARGHALVQGRQQLTVEDLPIVARAALESTPNDRRAASPDHDLAPGGRPRARARGARRSRTPLDVARRVLARHAAGRGSGRAIRVPAHGTTGGEPMTHAGRQAAGRRVGSLRVDRADRRDERAAEGDRPRVLRPSVESGRLVSDR